MSERLMILVAGPYRSGTNDDPVLIQRNVDAMEDTALAVFRRGHLPVLGEWFALPLLKHAGSTKIGDAVFDEIFHPIARELIDKCDDFQAGRLQRGNRPGHQGDHFDRATNEPAGAQRDN